MNPNYYTVGSASPFVGKSLKEINAGFPGSPQGIGFNPDDFARYLGISSDQPLTAGMQLNYNGGVNQGDTNMIGRILTPQTQAQRDALQAQANNDFIIKQNQPAISAVGSAITNTQGAYGSAVSQYQGEIPNIQSIYQDTINNLIKASNKEYGARGVQGDSFSVAQDQANLVKPTQNQESNSVNQFLNAIAGLQTGGAASVSNLQQVLGGLQSGAPLQSLQTSLSQSQIPFQNASAAAQAALANAQAQAAQYLPIPYLGALNTKTGQPVSFAQAPSAQASNGQTVYWVNGGWATTPNG